MPQRFFSKTSPAPAGLRIGFGAVSAACIAVTGGQWAFGPSLKRSCVEKLESLELASQSFLTGIAAVFFRGRASGLGWAAALRAPREASTVPPGSAAGLLEITSDAGTLIEARLLHRFSAEWMPGLDRFGRPLMFPRLLSLPLQSAEWETLSPGNDVTRRLPSENPRNRDRFWPLKTIRVSRCTKAKNDLQRWFVVLFKGFIGGIDPSDGKQNAIALLLL